jgi:hypothetical protein
MFKARSDGNIDFKLDKVKKSAVFKAFALKKSEQLFPLKMRAVMHLILLTLIFKIRH